MASKEAKTTTIEIFIPFLIYKRIPSFQDTSYSQDLENAFNDLIYTSCLQCNLRGIMSKDTAEVNIQEITKSDCDFFLERIF